MVSYTVDTAIQLRCLPPDSAQPTNFNIEIAQVIHRRSDVKTWMKHINRKDLQMFPAMIWLVPWT
jgi:hypothetical protein